MRIISMHVLQWRKADKALFLKSSFEIGFISFLKRYFFKEHLMFGARTCAT